MSFNEHDSHWLLANSCADSDAEGVPERPNGRPSNYRILENIETDF
jgi:hypothetical protein